MAEKRPVLAGKSHCSPESICRMHNQKLLAAGDPNQGYEYLGYFCSYSIEVTIYVTGRHAAFPLQSNTSATG